MRLSIQLGNIFLSAALALTVVGCSASSPIENSLTADESQVMSEATTTVTVKTEAYEEPSETQTTPPAATKPIVLTSNTTMTTRENNPYAVEELLNSMSLIEKVYQMFMVTPEGLTGFSGSVTEAGQMTKDALEKYPVGGLIYFSENIENWSQTKNMLASAQKFSKESNHDIGLFMAVDEEGGDVARISQKLGVYNSYDMEHYGSELNYSEVYNLGCTIGSVMSDLGFNVDLAPVADVSINPENELGSRIFSGNPQVVSDLTREFINGIEGNGVSATLKHFPGLGAGDHNTHDTSVYMDRSHDQLAMTEFLAFQGGIYAGVDFVMVGHQITSASMDNRPGDLSKTVVTDWLKGELGFTGLVITDSQSMGAIVESFAPSRAAVESIKAGVDIILMPYDLANAADGVLTALKSGELTEERINESVRKILTKKVDLGLIEVESATTETKTTYYYQYQ